jgi:hypothetical protein
MRAWKVEYTVPNKYDTDMALVLAITATRAIRLTCSKLHIGPTRIQSATRVNCDEVIVK